MVALFTSPQSLVSERPQPHLQLVADPEPQHRFEVEEVRAIVFSLIGFIALAVALISLRSLQYSSEITSQEQAPAIELASSFNTYIVQPGDTLWTIASSQSEGDPRALVSELSNLNGGDEVWVGQSLIMPAKS